MVQAALLGAAIFVVLRWIADACQYLRRRTKHARLATAESSIAPTSSTAALVPASRRPGLEPQEDNGDTASQSAADGRTSPPHDGGSMATGTRTSSGRSFPAVGNATEGVTGGIPLLVCVLAGNPLTGAAILACLNTVDAQRLRRLHPAVSAVVAGVPWCDMDTPVVDAVRWRAALPASVGAMMASSAGRDWLESESAVAALGGITHLVLHECVHVNDELLLRLPTSLRVLSVYGCNALTPNASFAHLTVLRSLDCSWTAVVSERTDGLPPSLQKLNINCVPLREGVSLAHLRQLRVLRADWSRLGTITLASMPPSLKRLHASYCTGLTPTASFAHLTALRFLHVAVSDIGDASLASMPPRLRFLDAHGCKNLTPASVLPHLPALQALDISGTAIGDALVASMPASLVELRLVDCSGTTTSATLDHLCALRLLDCIGSQLAPAALVACRARGCTVRTAGMLRGHRGTANSLVLLADGRLASGDACGEVRLWDVAARSDASVVLRAGSSDEVRTLAALRDGRRLAAVTSPVPALFTLEATESSIEVWDVGGVQPAHPFRPSSWMPAWWQRWRAAINCDFVVGSFAVLADGRLAAGCNDGTVRIVDVDAGTVVGTLTGHTGSVTALAVLRDGALASGSWDMTVRVWDMGTLACVATLTGHTCGVLSLAVLPDGRLASGSWDTSVRLWDLGVRACVRVLTGHTGDVTALASLPDGRLATAAGFDEGTIRVWDTRSAAAAGASRAVGTVPVEVVGVLGGGVEALLPLPDGRLACCGSGAALYLLELPPAAPCE